MTEKGGIIKKVKPLYIIQILDYPLAKSAPSLLSCKLISIKDNTVKEKLVLD
jgi:hypothetical protein